ncbi:hypothetical protein Tco_0421469 [Tanacetum coccineum]
MEKSFVDNALLSPCEETGAQYGYNCPPNSIVSNTRTMQKSTIMSPTKTCKVLEDLVPIPSESEGLPDKMCDVPLCENTTPLEALKEHSETIIDYNDETNFSDDDS